MTDQALNPLPAPSAEKTDAVGTAGALGAARTAEPAATTGGAAGGTTGGTEGPAEAAPTVPAMAKPADERGGALPGAAAYFTGRERELTELRGEIERPGLGAAGRTGAARARVLLVVGRPGVGRTAVALRLAREVGHAYPDGHFFVRLTAAGGAPVPVERAARTLLRAMNTDPGGTEATAALRAATAGRRLLLVLDDVGHPEQLARLLPDAPGSLVVATSDGPLSGVPDVRPCTLGGLDTPAALDLLAHSIGDTRVTNDPRAAEALIQEVAGHPTALRLVGAWLAAQPRFSVSDAAARLRATPALPFTRPSVPEPAAPDTTPRASAPAELIRAFRVVYEELPPAAARLLRLLVLAPAGAVDSQVASALAGCSVASAQGTLDDFVANALLTAGPAEDGYRVPGCLEPMLRGLVDSTDRPEDVRLARARMLERTVRLLESCRAALTAEPPGDGLPRTLRFATTGAAADWLRSRLPALTAAARAAVADGALDTLARRLIAALVRALVAFPGGETTAAERYELHRLVLGVAERRGLHREKAAALINLADLDAEAGRGDRAIEIYRQGLDAARACDDTEAEGRIMEALGSTYLERRDLARASDWFGRALALRQARGELAPQARLHARIGSVLTHLGRYGPALREWRSAARVHRRLGDLPSQARALAEAARVQEYAGQHEDALRSCRDALYWARQARDRRLEAAVLLRLADTLDRLGDAGGARLQRAAARRLFRPGEFPLS